MAKLIGKIKAVTEYKISLTEEELNYLVVVLGHFSGEAIKKHIKSEHSNYGSVSNALDFVDKGKYYNLYSQLTDILIDD